MADLQSFLKLIKALESGNNPDVVHRTIASGVHEGDAAVGSAGLMPNTAKEIAGRRLSSGEGGRADELMRDASNEETSAMLRSNPDMQEAYVQDLGARVLKKSDGDPALAATGWLYGHNTPKSKLQKLLEADPGYQERINQKIGELRLQTEAPLLSVPSLNNAFEQSLKPKIEPMSKLRKTLTPQS